MSRSTAIERELARGGFPGLENHH
ncbi:hypothetical protein NC652_027418 [Populus alba x Populus x berolinensis]|nr:hypothetical protein NC652_027418 [Populus alba x Populus x berolinensis]